MIWRDRAKVTRSSSGTPMQSVRSPTYRPCKGIRFSWEHEFHTERATWRAAKTTCSWGEPARRHAAWRSCNSRVSTPYASGTIHLRTNRLQRSGRAARSFGSWRSKAWPSEARRSEIRSEDRGVGDRRNSPDTPSPSCRGRIIRTDDRASRKSAARRDARPFHFVKPQLPVDVQSTVALFAKRQPEPPHKRHG